MQVGIEGAHLHLIKSVHDKPTGSIIFNGEKLKVFPLQPGKKQGFPFSPLLLNKVLEVLTIEIRWEKEIKGIQIEREEVNLLLSADDMILYIGIPEVFTLKLWELKWIQKSFRIWD